MNPTGNRFGNRISSKIAFWIEENGEGERERAREREREREIGSRS